MSEAVKKLNLTLPTVSLMAPKNFNFSGPGFLFDNGYGAFMFDLTYLPPIPDIPCGEYVLLQVLVIFELILA